MRKAAVFFIVTLMGSLAMADVREGETAPMVVSVDEKMRSLDMADLVDGAPLVFLYGSAT